MAKSFMVAALVAATALCFAVALTTANDDNLIAVGHVYCDPCRVQFQTKISTPINGATVKLTCRSRENDTVSYEVEGKTDSTGGYSLAVKGDHEDDICEVRVTSSPATDCNIPFTTVDSARVLMTKNVGVVSPLRLANALGFITKEADQRCGQVLQDMGFPPLDIEELMAFTNHN